MGQARLRQQARRTGMADAVAGAFAPAADRVELERREALKAELRRLIGVVDTGDFGAMIVTELQADAADGRTKMVTNLLGDLDIIKMSAGNVVQQYAETAQKKQQRKGFSLVQTPES